MSGRLYHLVRSTTSERTLCSKPATAGCLTIGTAGVAVRHQLHLCSRCVESFQTFRDDRGRTYLPASARLTG